MSLLAAQVDELREAARNIQGKLGRCLYRRKDVDEMQQVSGMLFEAANTIEWLREKAQAATLERGECELIDRGKFMPSHEFHRVECSKCGALFWQSHGRLPVARFCPSCGKAVKR